MMKIDFPIPTDGKMHRFCIVCKAEGATQEYIDGKATYPCPHCGARSDRAIYFNKHEAWLDDNNELWHWGAMVFVRNSSGKFLFFERNEYPFALTVPAGHADRGEKPAESARRELVEETGIVAKDLTHITEIEIIGDSCSSGADSHKVHIYLHHYDGDNNVQIIEEGEKALWLSFDEALDQKTTFQTEYIITHFREQLEV